MLRGQVRQLGAEDDVVVRVDAPDERDAGAVGGVGEDAARELVAGGYALAARDEGDVRVLVGPPLVARDRGEGDGVARLEGVEVGRGLAVGVVLDEEL